MRQKLPFDLLMLEQLLISVMISGEAMLLDEVDGFFTGLNFYTSRVEPEEWLPLIWNKEAPVFEDEAQARWVTQALVTHYEDVARRLNRGELEPIYGEEVDDSPAWELWLDGFWRAGELRPGRWMEGIPEDDKNVDFALFSLLRLRQLATNESADFERLEIDEELQEAAAELIPDSVVFLHRLLRPAHPLAGGRRGPGASRKVGRNEPCPCGSGKKYKKCCVAV